MTTGLTISRSLSTDTDAGASGQKRCKKRSQPLLCGKVQNQFNPLSARRPGGPSLPGPRARLVSISITYFLPDWEKKLKFLRSASALPAIKEWDAKVRHANTIQGCRPSGSGQRKLR